jgi:hypothetical protein
MHQLIWPCNQQAHPGTAIISRYGDVRFAVHLDGGRPPGERNVSAWFGPRSTWPAGTGEASPSLAVCAETPFSSRSIGS